MTDDDLEYEEVNIDANNNVVRTNSGLLDDLLHEAQEKIGGGSLKRQKVECDFQWDISSSENSSTGEFYLALVDLLHAKMIVS